jgi:hypothetical protein
VPHGQISETIPASAGAVFDLVHDYSRRLEWDTLLKAAYMEDGYTAAAKGATSVCVGRNTLGGIALKTIYVSFDRPHVAAVKMVNTTLFFESWAASIRHKEISPHRSEIIYEFQFTTKPRFLRFILDPLMQRIFLWETRKRLRALKAFFLRTLQQESSHESI